MSKPSMVCAREMGGHGINGIHELMSDTSTEHVRVFRISKYCFDSQVEAIKPISIRRTGDNSRAMTPRVFGGGKYLIAADGLRGQDRTQLNLALHPKLQIAVAKISAHSRRTQAEDPGDLLI